MISFLLAVLTIQLAIAVLVGEQIRLATHPYGRFIKALKKAHSGELAAFLAYEGHWRALNNSTIRSFQWDELYHKQAIESMLLFLDERPSLLRDSIFYVVGRVAGTLCYVVPAKWSNLGARMIETFGRVEYQKIAEIAPNTIMAESLTEMGNVEAKHEYYFRNGGA